jgi:hypothetical protein
MALVQIADIMTRVKSILSIDSTPILQSLESLALHLQNALHQSLDRLQDIEREHKNIYNVRRQRVRARERRWQRRRRVRILKEGQRTRGIQIIQVEKSICGAGRS